MFFPYLFTPYKNRKKNFLPLSRAIESYRWGKSGHLNSLISRIPRIESLIIIDIFHFTHLCKIEWSNWNSIGKRVGKVKNYPPLSLSKIT
ncbi:MAG: hypothetical protein C6I01_06075 [Epsilonproteobacteria bacterium]|nr:hypothetical protein [Campylobacterota bacterium]